MSKAAIVDAVRALDVRATKALLAATPSLLSVVDRQGRNLLHLACSVDAADLQQRPAAQVRLVDLLLDRGMAIDVPMGRDKCTALWFAVARARSKSLVTRLIARGAQVSAAPGDGLFAAGWWQDLPILRVLLDAGARIELVVGVTPFLACWCWKRFDAAKWLAVNGADVNYQDDRGRTALHHGIEKDFDPALLAWLVKHGASADLLNGAGVSARAAASRKRDRRFREALE
jgi:ankyrin repeat protein